MKVAVLLKLVSKSHYTDSIGEQTKDRLSTGQLVINPADEYALEQALRIRDAEPDTIVTVITMAPESAQHLLYEAMAMGADEAVHISDRVFAGSDTMATARVLGAAMEKLPPQDLILCGQRAIDSETGQIGPRLAVHLHMPVAAHVLAIRHENDKFIMTRLQDDGVRELQCGHGVVVTICRGTEMVRTPTIMGKRRAMNQPVTMYSNQELGVDTSLIGLNGCPTKVVRTEQIRYANRGKVGTADVSSGADAVVDILRKEQGGNV